MMFAVKKYLIQASPYIVAGWKHAYPLAIKSAVYTRDHAMNILKHNFKFTVSLSIYYCLPLLSRGQEGEEKESEHLNRTLNLQILPSLKTRNNQKPQNPNQMNERRK